LYFGISISVFLLEPALAAQSGEATRGRQNQIEVGLVGDFNVFGDLYHLNPSII
jgi:hypothetical protein